MLLKNQVKKWGNGREKSQLITISELEEELKSLRVEH